MFTAVICRGGSTVFEEHNAAVRREVPADRLLEFQVSEGWWPLCDFLGRPVPDEPFPRTNDNAAFQALLAEKEGADRPEGDSAATDL